MVPPRFTTLHRSSSISEQKGTTKPASDKINYVLTKLQLNDGNTNDRAKWEEKETKSSCSSSPTQGKLVAYNFYHRMHLQSWSTRDHTRPSLLVMDLMHNDVLLCWSLV
jgi:hypothetical protein